MKPVVTALLLCSVCVDVNVGLSHWELQTLDVPPSHIPYFTRNKDHDHGFCKDGKCQVYHWVRLLLPIKV